MKHTIIVLTVLSCIGAHATGSHTPPTPPSTPTYTGQQQQGQDQQQAQLQAQQAAARAAAEANGNGAGAGSNNATEQNLNLDMGGNRAAGSGDSYDNRVIVHPSMVPPHSTAINPQGNLLAVRSACGPQRWVEKEPVYATSQGFWGGTEQVPNGFNYRVHPVRDDNTGKLAPFEQVRQADGSTILMGTELIVGMSITNQSVSVSGAAGLIRASGAGGQIGGGASTALQQMGDRIIAVPCIAAIVPAAAAAPVALEQRRPPIRPAPRRAPVRNVAVKSPDCMAQALATCQLRPSNTAHVGR
jgi:hypothetical protein